MNERILNRYYKLADERANPKQTQADTEKDDHLLALRLQKEEGQMLPARRGRPAVSKVSKPRAKTSLRKAPNNAFNAELILSPQLQEVVGNDRMSRPQVVKQMWVYIREHDLQNASDKRQIICDEKLANIFKKNKVTMFEMNKLLSKHLYKEDELTDAGVSQVKNDLKTEDKAGPRENYSAASHEVKWEKIDSENATNASDV